MSDCEGDFKCAYCKGFKTTGPTILKPEILWGACEVAALNDHIKELEAENAAWKEACNLRDRALTGDNATKEDKACSCCDGKGWYVINCNWNQPEGEQAQCPLCATKEDV